MFVLCVTSFVPLSEYLPKLNIPKARVGWESWEENYFKLWIVFSVCIPSCFKGIHALDQKYFGKQISYFLGKFLIECLDSDLCLPMTNNFANGAVPTHNIYIFCYAFCPN